MEINIAIYTKVIAPSDERNRKTEPNRERAGF